jgi:hypothetical protein
MSTNSSDVTRLTEPHSFSSGSALPDSGESCGDGVALPDGGQAVEHSSSADCWCQPEKVYVDPDTGDAVYVHRGKQ